MIYFSYLFWYSPCIFNFQIIVLGRSSPALYNIINVKMSLEGSHFLRLKKKKAEKKQIQQQQKTAIKEKNNWAKIILYYVKLHNSLK